MIYFFLNHLLTIHNQPQSTPEEPPEPLSIVIDLILPEYQAEPAPNDIPMSSMDEDSFWRLGQVHL